MSKEAELAERLPIQIGSVIAGKYRVERLLAAGGMGAVVCAHHEVLDQTVAIKVMRPELAHHREAAQRFLREARAAAKIASDYVARVTDVDLLEDETPFMVMEYLEGCDLDGEMAANGPFPLTIAVDYVMQALAGLEAAHALGVVHRDLKPSNLFLVRRPDGSHRVKVLDFGISKVMDGAETGALKAGATTASEAMLGTPRYMSPEQIASAKDVDGRTDIWSMGLILYEFVTGDYPFDGDSAGAILSKILTAEIPPLRTLRREVPVELEDAVLRCLARDREQRFANVRELMVALGPFASRRMRTLLLHEDEPLEARARDAAAGSPGKGRAARLAPVPTGGVEPWPTEAPGPASPTLKSAAGLELDDAAAPDFELARNEANETAPTRPARQRTPRDALSTDPTRLALVAAPERTMPAATHEARRASGATDTNMSAESDRTSRHSGTALKLGAAVAAIAIVALGGWLVTRTSSGGGAAGRTTGAAPTSEAPAPTADATRAGSAATEGRSAPVNPATGGTGSANTAAAASASSSADGTGAASVPATGAHPKTAPPTGNPPATSPPASSSGAGLRLNQRI